jgi:hypothetical protein
MLKQRDDDNWDDDDDLTEQDRAALALAIEMKRSFGKADREQINAFLKGERKAGFPDEWAVEPRPWLEVPEPEASGLPTDLGIWRDRVPGW